MYGRRAFTLVELLAVASIISSLLMVLVPAISGARELGRRVQCGANLKDIGVAIPMYADQSDGMLMPNGPRREPNVIGSAGNNPSGIATSLQPYKLGSLLGNGLIGNPRTLYCQSTVTGDSRANSYMGPSADLSWGQERPATGGNPWVRSDYYFTPISRERTSAGKLRQAGKAPYTNSGNQGKFADLHPSYPMSTDTMLLLGQLNHIVDGGAKGINSVFVDGSVVFVGNEAMFDKSLWKQGTDNVDKDDHRLEPWSPEFFEVISFMHR